MPNYVKRRAYGFTLGRAIERVESAQLPKLASAQLRLAKMALEEGNVRAAGARIDAADELVREIRERGEQLTISGWPSVRPG